MNRRKFLAGGAVASAAAVTQAVAQTPSLPSIRWRCASSFPKSLDTIYEARPGVCRKYPDSTHCGYYDFLKFEREQQGDEEIVAMT